MTRRRRQQHVPADGSESRNPTASIIDNDAAVEKNILKTRLSVFKWSKLQTFFFCCPILSLKLFRCLNPADYSVRTLF